MYAIMRKEVSYGEEKYRRYSPEFKRHALIVDPVLARNCLLGAFAYYFGIIRIGDRHEGNRTVFRRFMIVCWVLFALGAIGGLVGYVGYRVNAEPELSVEQTRKDSAVSKEGMTREERLSARRKALVDHEQKRHDRRERRQSFEVAGWIGALLAGVMLLWNIVCHTSRWVWAGRDRQ